MKKRRYENIDITTTSSFKELIRWRKERSTKKKDLSYRMPVAKDIDEVFLQTNRSIPSITWIGHSTFLIQLNGLNILTDPVWANRLGSDKRLTPPGIAIKDLPPIDYVLISHSHYDHLHYTSIKKLLGNPKFLVPEGLEKWFMRKGFKQIIEFSWWDEKQLDGLTFVFVPAQHWTKRTLTDTNTSHWGGWIIQEASHTLYFAGDSGYFKGFQDIGDKYDIDYCLMPIGAYEPEWFMGMQHVNPEEAVKAFLDTRSNVMIPMHYGAFRLADDTPKEALDRLLDEWKKNALDERQLRVLKTGETLKLLESE